MIFNGCASKWSWTLTCLTAGRHAQSPAARDDREPLLPLPSDRKQDLSGLGLGDFPVIREIYAPRWRLHVHLKRPESSKRRSEKQNGELLDCGDAEVSVLVVFRRHGSGFSRYVRLQHGGSPSADLFLAVPCSVFLDYNWLEALSAFECAELCCFQGRCWRFSLVFLVRC